MPTPRPVPRPSLGRMATAPEPCGARLRRQHSPRSRPASPLSPQRLAAMLELVRHRLRQWKERAGEGDPRGGAAERLGGGTVTGEATPRPKRDVEGRGPQYSRTQRRAGGWSRLEAAGAGGGGDRPPPPARHGAPPPPAARPAAGALLPRVRPAPRGRPGPLGRCPRRAWAQGGKAPERQKASAFRL